KTLALARHHPLTKRQIVAQVGVPDGLDRPGVEILVALDLSQAKSLNFRRSQFLRMKDTTPRPSPNRRESKQPNHGQRRYQNHEPFHARTSQVSAQGQCRKQKAESRKQRLLIEGLEALS